MLLCRLIILVSLAAIVTFFRSLEVSAVPIFAWLLLDDDSCWTLTANSHSVLYCLKFPPICTALGLRYFIWSSLWAKLLAPSPYCILESPLALLYAITVIDPKVDLMALIPRTRSVANLIVEVRHCTCLILAMIRMITIAAGNRRHGHIAEPKSTWAS